MQYSVCESFKFCELCRVSYRTHVRIAKRNTPAVVVSQENLEDGQSGHIHRGRVCDQCQAIKTPDHDCYFAFVNLPSPEDHEIVWFDTESTQLTSRHETVLIVHTVGLGVNPNVELKRFKEVQSANPGLNYDNYEPVPREEKNSYFVSEQMGEWTPAQQFIGGMLDHLENRVKALQEMRKENPEDKSLRFKHSGFTAIGFNASGYDYPMMMQAMVHNRDSRKLKPLFQGTRLLKATIGSGVSVIRFIDANRFITGSLERTVATFNLQPELKALGFPPLKGVTPMFKLPYDYEGEFPDEECFLEKHRKALWFKDWYQTERKQFVPFTDKLYVYAEHLIEYCAQDTRILRLAGSAFRDLFLKATDGKVDPFMFTTVSSACISYYCSQLMPKDTPIANLSILVNNALRFGYLGGRVQTLRSFFPVWEPKTKPHRLTKFRPTGPRAYLVADDVNSMYPAVLIYGLYPHGHPIWYLTRNEVPGDFLKRWRLVFEPLREFDKSVEDNVRLDDIPGCLDRFVGGEVLSFLVIDYTCDPTMEYPVLPRRSSRGNEYSLQHGVFEMVSSVELEVALDFGYQVTAIYAVAFWPSDRCSRTLFTDYYKKFNSIKVAASGLPKGVRLDDYVKAYEDYPLHCGARLDPDQVNDNPGLKEIAKVIMNSFYGRWAMNDSHPETNIFDMNKPKDRQTFYETIFNIGEYHVHGEPIVIEHPTEKKANVQLSYRKLDKETRRPNQKSSPTNVAIAAFVTAYSRMHLFKYIRRLSAGRLMYCDTDCVIYEVDPDRKDEPVGEGQLRWNETFEEGQFLGQMKREPTSDAKIMMFSSSGKKMYNYHYVLKDSDWQLYLQMEKDGKQQPDCVCQIDKKKCKAILHSKVVAKGLPNQPGPRFAYAFSRVGMFRHVLGLPPQSPYECVFTQLVRKAKDQSIVSSKTVRRWRFFNPTTINLPDGRCMPHGHSDTESVTHAWEESSESVREFLLAAEEELDMSAGLSYNFAFASEPSWVTNPKTPEELAKFNAYCHRQHVRAVETAQREMDVARADDIAHEAELILEEQNRQAAAAEENARNRIREIMHQVEEDKEPDGLIDDRAEEDLDLNDNGEEYGMDQEEELDDEVVNEFLDLAADED